MPEPDCWISHERPGGVELHGARRSDSCFGLSDSRAGSAATRPESATMQHRGGEAGTSPARWLRRCGYDVQIALAKAAETIRARAHDLHDVSAAALTADPVRATSNSVLTSGISPSVYGWLIFARRRRPDFGSSGGT